LHINDPVPLYGNHCGSAPLNRRNKKIDLEEVVKSMFLITDTDGSGSVTHAEFRENLYRTSSDPRVLIYVGCISD
jgi:hypothetical protein